MQGLILSKDLKVQKDAEDARAQMAIGNLRFKVFGLRHEVEEKETMLNTLAEDMIESRADLQKSLKEKDNKISKLEADNLQSIKCIKELEARMKKEFEAHKVEMTPLKEKFQEMNENFELQNAKHKIAEDEWDKLQKMLMSFGSLSKSASPPPLNVVKK